MSDDLERLLQEMHDLRERIGRARRDAPPEAVAKDYEFRTTDGEPVSLSDLFGDREDLLVVHNMGSGCPYCTLWADGFSGLTDHLNDRASFVLCSADEPTELRCFSSARGWKFRCVSGAESDFARDMGFEEKGKPKPGVSAFHRDKDGAIVRTGSAPFGPGDEFCALWHFFDLLKDGPGKWAPKYEY